jgi:hypothetical protein
VVTRPLADTDLLPRESPAELKNILLGQRELHAVSAFPLQDYVALGDESATVAVFAKGIRSYVADASGAISLLLQRSVEWLTRADLRDRVGDAGPFFYVPDARGERTVRHEVGVACVRDAGDSMAVQRLNAAFQLPPLLVRTAGSGSATSWRLLQEDAPLSSVQVVDGSVLARFANPTRQAQPLSAPYQQTDVWGAPGDAVASLAPKAIVTLRVPTPLPAPASPQAPVELLTPPAWRVGPNAGRPDPAVLAALEAKRKLLAAQAAGVAAEIEHASGPARLRLQHRTFVLQRESVELELSRLLNQRKLATDGALREASLYQLDEEVAAVGLALNQLRIKRRIFDYVVAAL